MIIPNKIYLYFIIFIIIVSILISVYIYLTYNMDSHKKLLFIWFVIILELNLIHLYIIINFYEKNKNKIGIQGPKGDKGPRGFTGKNQVCNSCDGAGLGSDSDKYGGVIDDKDNIKDSEIDSNKLVPGKCVFPFINNYQYVHTCDLKNKTPLGTNAEKHGWCATKVDDDLKPITFGYCNPKNEAKIESSKAYLQKKQAYVKDNYGILDIFTVQGNTENDAKQKCIEHGDGQYKIYTPSTSDNSSPFDLNEDADGKFIYFCHKNGVGGKGIKNLKIGKKCSEYTDENLCNESEYCNFNGSCKTKKLYKKVPINLNEAAANSELDELYLYKQYDNTNFIKNFEIVDDNNGCPENYKSSSSNLDFGGSNTNMNLCLNKIGDINNITIDTAFVYKDKRLYVFKGSKFYKMTKTPIQLSLSIENNYPKYISEKWIKSSNNNNNNIEDCSIYNDDKKMCNSLSHKCFFDSIFSTTNINGNNGNNDNSGKGFCQPKLNYNAAFTYGYNNKTYFFKGNNVYLYDDENMTIANGYPKPIEFVFKGVPGHIDAVFTWGKDKKTYFFKGRNYYKYNDKKNKVENGYPKSIIKRWPGCPTPINAIFTLSKALNTEAESDKYPTYIINNSQSKLFYIDQFTDNINPEGIGEISEKLQF